MLTIFSSSRDRGRSRREFLQIGTSAIGGLTMGADPISCSVAFASHINKSDIGSFAIRKERKEHGMQKQVEGDVKQGDRVVIIDDVITTGGSTVKAIEAARREGLDIVKVIVLVDREEGGKEAQGV